MLQETGIGKTVNSFRKHEGSIGPKVKELIAQWKAVVSSQDGEGDQDTQGTGTGPLPVCSLGVCTGGSSTDKT